MFPTYVWGIVQKFEPVVSHGPVAVTLEVKFKGEVLPTWARKSVFAGLCSGDWVTGPSCVGVDRFAVRWHPLYRIPEAPLRAEFLTFHSFQPVPVSSTLFGAIDAGKIDAARTSCSGQGQRVLPIIAMRALIPKVTLQPFL